MTLHPGTILLMASLKGSLTFGREKFDEGGSASSGIGSFFSGLFGGGNGDNSSASFESGRDIWSDVRPWELGSDPGNSEIASRPEVHGELGTFATNSRSRVPNSILRPPIYRSYKSALEDLSNYGLLNPNTDPNELLILLDLEKSRRFVWDVGYMCQRAEWGMAEANRNGIGVKPGVILALHDSIKQAFPVVSEVFRKNGVVPIITSGSLDHPSKDDPKSTSSHPPGRGTDWRFNQETTGVHDLEQRRARMDKVAIDVYNQLSKNKHVTFRVLSEHWPDSRVDHLHIDTLDARNKKSGPGAFLFDRTTTPPTFIRLPRAPSDGKKGSSTEQKDLDVFNSESSLYTPDQFKIHLETNLKSGTIVLGLAEKLGAYMVDNSDELGMERRLVKPLRVNLNSIRKQLDEIDASIREIDRRD